jgi:hypothetical protein
MQARKRSQTGELALKKRIIILMIAVMMLGLVGCGAKPANQAVDGLPSAADTAGELYAVPVAPEEAHDPGPKEVDEPTEECGQSGKEDESVTSYREYLEAAEDSPVTIDAYVQAKEALRGGLCCLYIQNTEGAFYLSRMRCSQDEYDCLEIGRKIRVNGYKSHWNDSLEISDASFQPLDGSWIAEARDVTALLGTEELIRHQNEKVCFHGMTIEAMPDGCSVWYNGWDNTAPEGEDSELWFRASYEGTAYDFTVKPSLCPNAEEALNRLTTLQTGDTVILTGYLRYYNGALPRITEIVCMDGNLTDES